MRAAGFLMKKLSLLDKLGRTKLGLQDVDSGWKAGGFQDGSTWGKLSRNDDLSGHVHDLENGHHW